MLKLALIFFLVGLVALALGFGGIAGLTMDIAWILFVVGLILAIIFFVMGRRPSV